LKDLQRFLRRDSPETRDAFMLLGRYNLAKTDLVPLLITYPNDEELLYNALKVVTYLTMPIAPDSDAQMQQAEYMQQVNI
jgi:timeless